MCRPSNGLLFNAPQSCYSQWPKDGFFFVRLGYSLVFSNCIFIWWMYAVFIRSIVKCPREKNRIIGNTRFVVCRNFVMALYYKTTPSGWCLRGGRSTHSSLSTKSCIPSNWIARAGDFLKIGRCCGGYRLHFFMTARTTIQLHTVDGQT